MVTDSHTHNSRSGQKNFVISTPLLLLSCYIVSGLIAYSYVFENWSLIESMYFCVVTFTTVGYGDFGPTTQAGRLFTVFYAFAGVSMIGVSLGDLMDEMTEASEERSHELQKSTSLVDKQEKTDDASLNIMANYTMRVFLKQNKHYLFIMIAMLIFVYIFNGRISGQSFIDVTYLWAATITTIGYGDISPDTTTERAASIVVIPVATYAMATLIGKYIEFRLEKKTLQKQQDIIDRGLRESDIKRMDADGSGKVSRLEFIEFMLLTMDKVDQDDLDQLHRQFSSMDTDGSDNLDKADIIAAIEEKKRRNRLRHQQQNKDSQGRFSFYNHERELEIESGFDDPHTPLL